MQNDFPNIRHMRVFIEAARTGSVSIAAKNCHLSQPAATQAISGLEARLGTLLLIRRREKFTLTECGIAFQKRASAALQHLNDGVRVAARADGNTKRRTNFTYSMTAPQLRNLIAIANHGSFTVAAQHLGLSQPTLHRTARSLEAIARVPLFNARSSGIQLTPAAEALALGAKLAQQEIRQGKEEVGRILGRDQGTFVLGSLPLARTSIVPKAVHAMVSVTDGFQLRVVDGRYNELLRSLREGDLDCLIGALRNPAPADDVEQKVLFQDALVLVAHPDHPLANRQGVKLEDTMRFPWVAPPKETPAGQYLFNTLRIQERERTPVRVVSSSMVTLRGILSLGDYISIVSRHQIEVDESLSMITALDIPLEGNVRDIGLTFRKSWRPTETQALFIEYLHMFAQSDAQATQDIST